VGWVPIEDKSSTPVDPPHQNEDERTRRRRRSGGARRRRPKVKHLGAIRTAAGPVVRTGADADALLHAGVGRQH
jgi:hypothetical protein